jgi:hypothetical protein
VVRAEAVVVAKAEVMVVAKRPAGTAEAKAATVEARVTAARVEEGALAQAAARAAA